MNVPQSKEEIQELLELQVRAGAFDVAVELMRGVVEQQPDELWASCELGRLLLRENRTEEAATLLTGLEEKHPDSAEVIGLRGLFYHLRGELDDARAQYEKARAAQPDLAWILYNLARLSEQQGDEETCESCLDALLAQEADHYAARFQRARLYGRTERAEEMQAELRKTIDSNPLMLQPYLLLGEIFLRSGHAEESVKLYLHGLQANPLAHPLREALARLYTVLGDQEAAFGLRLELCRLRGKAEDFLELGLSALRNTSLEHAAVAFAKLCEVAPKDWRGHYNLAEVHRASGDYVKAFICYEKALACNENDRVLNGFALWHLEAEDALGEDERAEAKDLLASVSAQKARSMLEQALTLNPEMLEAQINLVLALCRLESFGEARERLESLSQALPEEHPFSEQLDELRALCSPS